jgi:hypothetical protein
MFLYVCISRYILFTVAQIKLNFYKPWQRTNAHYTIFDGWAFQTTDAPRLWNLHHSYFHKKKLAPFPTATLNTYFLHSKKKFLAKTCIYASVSNKVGKFYKHVYMHPYQFYSFRPSTTTGLFILHFFRVPGRWPTPAKQHHSFAYQHRIIGVTGQEACM